MGGDSVIGLSSHISVIDHLDMGASVAVAVILLLILCCMCAFRQGWCLTAILGRRWSHLNPQNQTLTSTAPPQQAQTPKVISMTPVIWSSFIVLSLIMNPPPLPDLPEDPSFSRTTEVIGSRDG